MVEDGKADDFFSLKAKEFVVTGTGRVTVEAGASRGARSQERSRLEHTAITWFLNQYLVDKETTACTPTPTPTTAGSPRW